MTAVPASSSGSSDPDDPRCTFHPDRATLIGCSRCDRPMCPACLRDAPVGMHCVECAGATAQRGAAPTAYAGRQRRPSWLFIALLAAFLGGCVWLSRLSWYGGEVPTTVRVVAITTGVLGWIVSLCLHEWAHAYAAYRFGDTSVVGKGYLSLDPRKYTDPLFSVALPVLFLLMGGIGLPGGAVWIDRSALRRRYQSSVVSAAGPAMNLVLGALCIAAARLLGGSPISGVGLVSSLLNYVALIQFATALLNLLPVPGLDGFGILAPWLPVDLRQGLERVAGFAILLFFLLVFTRPGALSFLFAWADAMAHALGADFLHMGVGLEIGWVTLR